MQREMTPKGAGRLLQRLCTAASEHYEVCLARSRTLVVDRDTLKSFAFLTICGHIDPDSVVRSLHANVARVLWPESVREVEAAARFGGRLMIEHDFAPGPLPTDFRGKPRPALRAASTAQTAAQHVQLIRGRAHPGALLKGLQAVGEDDGVSIAPPPAVAAFVRAIEKSLAETRDARALLVSARTRKSDILVVKLDRSEAKIITWRPRHRSTAHIRRRPKFGATNLFGQALTDALTAKSPTGVRMQGGAR